MSQELIAKQKAIADDVLEKLFMIDPYCIVAGGAPRDWWHGKPANDVDAFVHVRDGTTLGIINLMLEKAGFTTTSYKEEGSIPEMYKKNPDLRCVINIGNYETPVQIMIMREPTWDSVINKFPLSICKAWYKHGKVDVDKDFLNLPNKYRCHQRGRTDTAQKYELQCLPYGYTSIYVQS